MKNRKHTIVTGTILKVGEVDANGNVFTEEALRMLMNNGGLTVNIGGVAMQAQFEHDSDNEPPLMPAPPPVQYAREDGIPYHIINGIRVYEWKPNRFQRMGLSWKGIRFTWCDERCSECGGKSR